MSVKSKPRCRCEAPAASFEVVPEPMCQTCGLTVRRRPSPGPNGPLQAQAPRANGSARPPELARPAAQLGRDTARRGRVQAIADIRAALADPAASESAKRNLEFSLARYEGLEAVETTPAPEPVQVAHVGPEPPAPRAPSIEAIRHRQRATQITTDY